MLIWDRAQHLCKRFSGDTSSTMLSDFKILMNLGYKEILHTFTGEETEDVRTTPTQTGVRVIKLPPNYIRMNSVTATIGNQVYDLTEETSQKKWNQRLFSNRTSSRPTHYFIRPRFGVAGSELLLDPIPSGTDTTITINFASNARDLEVDEYTTGTVTATNGSGTITGAGTTFTEPMIGRYFKLNDTTDFTGDGNWYRITGRSSDTSITLENNYDGSTVTGKAFIIAEAFYLPEDLQMAPVAYTMWMYYLGIRKDKKEADRWELVWDKYRILAEKRYKRKGKSNTLSNDDDMVTFPLATPMYFPDSVSGS